MEDQRNWNFDKTVNLPTLFSVGGVAVTCLWWLFSIQSQTTANTNNIIDLFQREKEWKQTWQQFTSARDLAVRNYEQRMTSQEVMGREIMRRLDEIRDELRRRAPQ